MPPPFPSAASFPSGAYRLTNVSVPVCLLETKDGGDPASDTLAPAALTIACSPEPHSRFTFIAVADTGMPPAIAQRRAL